MPRISKHLEELTNIINIDNISEEHIEELEIDAEFVKNIEDNMFYITEQRVEGKVLHSIESVVLTIIFALIANCNRFTEMYVFMYKHSEWLNKFIRYDSGLPSLSTIKRVISFISPKELEKVCQESMKNFIRYNGPIYKDEDIEIIDINALDGKTSNSSGRNNSKNGKITKTNAMSAYSVNNDICLATEFISSKTNEIPTGPELLKNLNIANCVITFDAMSTQTKTVQYIVGKHAYYVAPVKGNQGTLEKNIQEYFEDSELYNKAKAENYYCELDKRNGDVDKREYIFTNDIEWLPNKEDWAGVKSIGMVKREYTDEKGVRRTDIRVYISNIDASKIKLLAQCIRSEWGIENKLHYYLDMVFDEDGNTCFVDNTQKNLNILRKFVLNMLKTVKKERKTSMNLLRFTISMDYENEIEDIMKTLMA